MIIEKISFNGFRIGIPIPFPMKYVYCYLFNHRDHYVLIDTGLNFAPARDAWNEVFRALCIKPQEIKTIYLTHFHPDHSGLCRWMQEKTGAEVYMHQVDLEMMERVWGEAHVQSLQVGKMACQHGTPKELSEQIIRHMEQLRTSVLPLPTINPIGAEVEFAGKVWQVVHTPGHSAGHICFFQAEEKVLIAGDHILDKISPNISVWPGASQVPLQEYIQSLLKVKELEVRVALPGHGKLIERVNERIDDLIAHHNQRLDVIAGMANGKSAYEIARLLFADKKLNPHQWRFAIAEIIAHFNYLTADGRVYPEGECPLLYYRLC